MSKRRRLFSEEELQRLLQVGREKLPEDQFQILQHIITSYSRLVALVREGTTSIERLREMFKIKRGLHSAPGDDRDTRPETPPPNECDGQAEG
jgi:hypothetical protein